MTCYRSKYSTLLRDSLHYLVLSPVYMHTGDYGTIKIYIYLYNSINIYFNGPVS